MSTRKANAGVSYAPRKSDQLVAKEQEEAKQTLHRLQREANAGSPGGHAAAQSKRHRLDGRALPALRPVFMKRGVVSRAVGSAYFEARDTKVICSIYGPRPSQRQMDFSAEGTVQCDVKFAPFAFQKGGRLADGQSSAEKELSLTVLRAVQGSVMRDKFPKSVLDIYVVVIAACGSVTAACINCASLALVDAGIELYDIVGAASVAGFDTPNLPAPSATVSGAAKTSAASPARRQLRLDPTDVEEETCDTHVTVAQMPSLGEVTLLQQSGKMTPKELIDNVRIALDATSLINKMAVNTALSGVEPTTAEQAAAPALSADE